MSLINIIAIAAQPAGTAVSLMARVYVGMMIGLMGRPVRVRPDSQAESRQHRAQPLAVQNLKIKGPQALRAKTP